MPKNFPEPKKKKKDLNSEILEIMCSHYLQPGELQGNYRTLKTKRKVLKATREIEINTHQKNPIRLRD